MQVDATFRSHSTFGDVPGEWVGTDAPDGDRAPWSIAPVGSAYLRVVGSNQLEKYYKAKNDGRNDDWVLEWGRIAQHIDYSEFTDGASTTGTLSLDASIPIGAYVLRSYLVNNTAATGVSALTIQIGDGTDVDRYSTGTPSVASAASIISLGAVSGTAVHTAAKTPIVTLTEDDDFTDITAWSTTVVIEYTGAAI